MGRRPNPQRKIDLLAEIVDYVLKDGLSDLSLRPLAKELGTSTYTLTYQFGSKEEMIAAVVGHFDERLNERLASLDGAQDTAADVVRNLWELATDEEGLRWSQVMLEVATACSRDAQLAESYQPTALPSRVARLADCIAPDGPGEKDTERATLAVASVQGLVVDLLMTGESGRVTRSFEQLQSQFTDANSAVLVNS